VLHFSAWLLLGPILPKIRADRVQLQQVLVSLMLNGIEVMKYLGGGELTVNSQLGQDGQLLLSLSDTVVGLPATFLTRLGESGCDAWTLARIAGHFNISISQHASDDSVANAMLKLSGRNSRHQCPETRKGSFRCLSRKSFSLSLSMARPEGFEPPTY
jgi:hypothetical protein